MSFHNFFVRHEKKIGGIASFLAVIMFVSLIEVFLSNFRGESQIFILPIATSVNGLFWTGYAYARKDIFIAIPNILALIFGLATAIAAFI